MIWDDLRGIHVIYPEFKNLRMGFLWAVVFLLRSCVSLPLCRNLFPFRMGFRPPRVQILARSRMIFVVWPSFVAIPNHTLISIYFSHFFSLFQDRLEVVSQDSLEPFAAHGIWSSEPSRLPVVCSSKRLWLQRVPDITLCSLTWQSDGEGFFHPLRSLSESIKQMWNCHWVVTFNSASRAWCGARLVHSSHGW